MDASAKQISQLGELAYQTLIEEHQATISTWPQTLQEQLPIAVGFSPFIAQSLQSAPELLQDLPRLIEATKDYQKDLKALLSDEDPFAPLNEDKVMQLLRSYRRQEILTIAWRDLFEIWPLEQSLAHLSLLAERLIMAAYHWHYADCCKLWGTPHCFDGKPQPMLILGMGKLGGGELNFSSDIDLIFTYPENGETQGARRSIDNSQFFTRLGQRLIKALDQVTQDGFCYRVDMRLRPFGESGPLAMSYSALEDYYQEQGRDWERYAMIKARVMGDSSSREYYQLQKMLMPFVFRRYIDFSAIDSLRRMKSMIRSEVRRRGLVNNIKLGAGGIREIEFIVQVFQLIRGGREPSLRGRSLLATLFEIQALDLLSKKETDELRQAYLFLRRLENLLQAIDDQQTQTLPDDPENQARLCFAMGFESWDQLLNQTQQHMQAVSEVFEGVIGEDPESECPQQACFTELWEQASDKTALITILEQEDLLANAQGEQAEVIDAQASAIHGFKYDLSKKTIGPRGREVLIRLMPKVFQAVFARKDAQFGLSRVLSLLQHIVTRTAYLELLETNQGALIQLVRLCSESPMISEQLSRYPILLDELLDPQQLYQPIPLDQYKIQLREFLARIPEEDMEQQMEALRQFKQISILKIAAADVADAMPVMQISDHLTYLAQAIVEQVIEQAWFQVRAKFGVPRYLQNKQDKGLGVLAYGKMGGFELGYQSDLDLVFLHQAPAGDTTDGEKEIDSFQFYLRLVQRIVHIFSVRMPSGILYEVDMRLRPSGESGLLACSLQTFLEYQETEAWTWEHQSLVRARMIYGSSDYIHEYQDVRKQVLTKVRDPQTLKQEIAGMREKMRNHLDKSTAERFYLKQGKGGITDIEFLVQYWVLSLGKDYPSLLEWSDNVRIIQEMAKQGLIKQEVAEQLIHAYTQMRDEVHRRNLLNLTAHVDNQMFVVEREQVISVWQSYFA